MSDPPPRPPHPPRDPLITPAAAPSPGISRSPLPPSFPSFPRSSRPGSSRPRLYFSLIFFSDFIGSPRGAAPPAPPPRRPPRPPGDPITRCPTPTPRGRRAGGTGGPGGAGGSGTAGESRGVGMRWDPMGWDGVGRDLAGGCRRAPSRGDAELPAVSAGKVELHGKVMEVDYSVPKKLR